MNKKIVIIIVVIIVLVIGGGVAYYLMNNKKSDTSTKSQNSTQVKTNLKGNELIQATLDKLKTQVPTIANTKVYTEATDPNNSLGKTQQYQYAGAFYDTRTNYKPPLDDSGNDVTIENDKYKTSAGGSIEIYANDKDATARGEYLANFQTGLVQAGAYKVEGNTVFRVSEEYTASQQQEMLSLMQKDYNEFN